MNKAKNSGNRRLLPYHVIKTAAGGDVDAINKILKHFEGYITALSTIQLYDENGNPHMVVDNEIRRTLETKLITKVLQFDADRTA